MTKLGARYQKNEVGRRFSGVKGKPDICYPMAYFFGSDYKVLDAKTGAEEYIKIKFFDTSYSLVSPVYSCTMTAIVVMDKQYVVNRTPGHIELIEVEDEDGTLFPELKNASK